MEALGLAIGIAGLYNTCLEAVKKVKSYKEYEFESQYTITQFDTCGIRLRKWAIDVGIADNKLKNKHHDKLDDPEFNSRAGQILYMIQQIFSNMHDISLPPQDRRNNSIEPLTVPSSLLENNTAVSTKQKPLTHRRDKMKWTLGGKNKFIDQINKFEKLVDMLYILIPPESGNKNSSFSFTEQSDELQRLQRRICFLVQ